MLTVVTASIPERADMLAEAMSSVRSQTHPVERHVVVVDHQLYGPVETLNAAMQSVTTKWAMILDDDDLLDSNHVETIFKNLRDDDDDIVFTQCRFDGDNYAGYLSEFSREGLETSSIVPMTAMFRVRLWNQLGGLRPVDDYDWDFWRRALGAGARFRKLGAVTWTYRFHGANLSREGIRGHKQ